MASSNHHRFPHQPGPPPPPPPPPLPPPPNNSTRATSAPSFQGVNDMGYLCPPPPPQSNTQNHQQMQSMHSMHHHTLSHHGYQQHLSNNPPRNSQYQHFQTAPQYYQPMHQQHYHPYSPPQYSNYLAAPPPPPPPPRQSTQRSINNKSINNAGRLVQYTNENAATAASLRQSLSTTNNASGKPKNVNPKMVKKYSGRGLKTVTVSGPGMPTRKFKICVGNHPDDIKKWIEERRKRFPRSDGSHRKASNETVSSRNHAGGTVLESVGGKRRSHEGNRENIATDRKRICLDGDAKNDCAIDDEETQTGGLSTLLAGYDSSSSQEKVPDSKDTQEKGESTEAPSTLDENSAKPLAALDTAANPQPKRLCRYFQRGKCRHGTSCKFLHSEAAVVNQRLSQSERAKAQNHYEKELQTLGLVTPSHGSRYTSGGKVIDNTSLLHKLLQRDKERECRMSLQLLRYITDCEYFQGENTSNSCGETDGDAPKQP